MIEVNTEFDNSGAWTTQLVFTTQD